MSFSNHPRPSEELGQQVCNHALIASTGTPLVSIFRSRCLLATFALAALGLSALSVRAQGSNPITIENAKTGNPASQWDIVGAGDLSIQGFATDISVNKGSTIQFKIDTDATSYRLDIYRLGYYGGMGARFIQSVSPSASLPQLQPDPITDATTGLIDCGNWAVSASWPVPATATSGLYIAKLVRTDSGGTGEGSHIAFVVRDDASTSDVFFQTSDTTWQAYNSYGGNSLYVGNPAGRAYKVSYNRPFVTRAGDTNHDWIFNAEYPMVRWLEANGYNVSYTTGVDSDRRGNLILQHKLFLSVGHDEYWSGTQRTNVEAARTAGVNLAFFSGNESFWKTRWENSTDGSATPYRTMVCYKETHANAKIDPTAAWTGTWRDPRFSPPADGGRPENALMGTLFTVNGPNEAMAVPASYGAHRFWRNTGIDTLAAGSTATLPFGTLGYEWDEVPDNGFRPAGLMLLSEVTYDGVDYLQDLGSTYASGTATHHLSLYRAASGALVFGAGSIQWSWGLDDQHDNGNLAPSPAMRQATVNLFADMSVQPATLQSGMITATASTDHTAPTSTILSPAAGATFTPGSLLTISGTASDTGGGRVWSVEVSIDNGATWHPANGQTNWTYSWSPIQTGAVTLKSRAVDDSGNLQATSAGVTVTIAGSAAASLWPANTSPSGIDGGPDSSAELGVKFKSDVAGKITGIRFYKYAANTGIHIGNLWSSTGTLLATATFSSETASGWQQVSFSAPVAITANTIYVASYHANAGHYSGDLNYFAANGVDNAPLHALANSTSVNGVFAYGAGSVFPDQTWSAANYWVDVVFQAGPAATLTSIAVTPASPSLTVGATQQFTATGTYSDSSTQNLTSQVTWVSSVSAKATITSAGLATGVAAGTSSISVTSGIVSGNTALTVQSSPLAINSTTLASGTIGTAYSATLAATGGTLPYTWSSVIGTLPTGLTLNASSGVISGTPTAAGTFSFTAQVKDTSSPVQTVTKSLNIAVAVAPTTVTIWPSTSVPALQDGGDVSAVEVGVKFSSDVAGSITGIRFYKASTNTGVHVGNLWSSTGTLLATATFSSETASGWQQVSFSAPISVTANTTYVASYHMNGGHYSADSNYFATAGIDHAPLHALANSASSNGIYAYGASSVFPNQTWNAANYWVDIVFQAGPAPTLTSVAITPASPTVTIGATQQFTATGTYSDSSTQNLTSQVTWTSSATAKATITSAGLATGVATGTSSISATSGTTSGSTTLTVTAIPLALTTSTLVNGTAGTAYSASFTASGGTTPYTWSLLSGTLPTGLTLNASTGAITGTPSVKGTFSFTAKVTDAGSPVQSATKALSITVTATLTSIAVTPANPTVQVGSTQQFTATGTYSDATTQNLTSQVTWGSSVPAKATITSAGLATGVAAGTSSISATSGIVSGSTTLTVQVVPLALTTTSLASGTIGTAYSATLAATGGTLPYTWSSVIGTLPTGLTLNASSGVISGTPTAAGTFSFTAQVKDTSSPVQTVTKSLNIAVAVAPTTVTIWPSTSVPALQDGGDVNAVEVGVKFSSDVAGSITGIRFYKASTNTGVHIGNLWSSTGTLLATATFSSESASGWQQVSFPAPVAITANTVYVASYHVNSGHYSADSNYFATAGTDHAPLHALANSASSNGIYAYGASSVFPNQTWNAANYWVDVVFHSGPAATLTSIAVTPASSTLQVGSTQQFTATGTYSDATTQNLTSQVTWASSAPTKATITSAGLATGVAAGTSTISATSGTTSGSTALTVQSSPLAINTTSLASGTIGTAYSATLAATGGTLPYTWSSVIGTLPSGLTLNASSGVISGTPTAAGTFTFTAQVKDNSSPVQTVTKSLSITVAVAPTNVTIWPNSTIPGLVDVGADGSVELGVKFTSDVTGSITGIRFYKSAANTGVHIGNLWSSTGTLLATAIFSSETASGWQQVSFPSPVPVTANTVYVASYHVNGGHYSAELNYFAISGEDRTPLHLLADGVSGPNGVFAYGASSIFPDQAANATNYWVDVIFTAGAIPDITPPAVVATDPVAGSGGLALTPTLTATFNEALNSSTVNTTTVTLRDSLNTLVPSSLTYDNVSASLKLTPNSPLNILSTYTLTVKGGTDGITDTSGNALAADFVTSFNTVTYGADGGGPGGPILVVTNTTNPFSKYYAEVLLAEGLNSFALADISALTTGTLSAYDVVILGETTLTPAQVTLLTNWVNAGGKLIAMRPDKQLAGLLGLTDAGSTQTEGYLLVNTTSGPGVGIVNQTIQYHGAADLYVLGSATSVATVYSNASASTPYPAITTRTVGANGGQAAAFTFNLAKSIVYTRQGNPAWADQPRDGNSTVRSDDLFFGAATADPQPDWVNFDNIAIPQADEQQHLLANMIIAMDAGKKPLPRFWFFPNDYKAVVVMTGDDHGTTYGGYGGTKGRFDIYDAESPTNGSADDWQKIRSTSYVFSDPNGGLPSDAEAVQYDAAGFEISLHLYNDLDNYGTPQALNLLFSRQMKSWRAMFPSLPTPVTHRMHAVIWNGYTIMPEVELHYGIRLDTSYYYWPGSWVADRPGFFTGSGLPMKFAKSTGEVVNVFQAATQMTDESDQSLGFTIDTLLDGALGSNGYYGAFVANMHTDVPDSDGSDAIVQSAVSRGVPIISAKQLLTWTDARNSSAIKAINWNANVLTFTVDAAAKARGLQTMVPVPAGTSVVSALFNGAPIAYQLKLIKGVNYAVVSSQSGNYQLTFVAAP